ncbi:MAG TPA: hypothetical protein VFV50_00220 [Bdellovibrionales bacterium]|nr:hypothetical protein [Bdellovibrionales bacterium]
MKALLASILILAACAPAREKQAVVYDDREYKTQSCEFAYTDGETEATRGTPSIVRLPLSKAYNRTALLELANLSGEASERLARQYGLTFHKVSRRFQDTCTFLADWPAAPADIQRFWEREVGGAGVVGLFLEQGNPELPSTRAGPVGIVREDGNRYIVIHEFMHHLFFIERDKAKRERQHDLQSQADRLAQQLRIEEMIADEPLNDRTVASLLELFEPLVTRIDALIKNSLAEEILIESILTEELNAGRLRFTPDGRANAREYIANSHRRAVRFYTMLLHKIEQYETSFTSAATRRRLQGLRENIQTSIREFDRLLPSQDPDWMRLTARNPAPSLTRPGHECAHAGQAARAVERALGALNPL